jgi:hypothetical protein
MKSCADAISSFVVKGKTEEEARENVYKACKWFDDHSLWD